MKIPECLIRGNLENPNIIFLVYYTTTTAISDMKYLQEKKKLEIMRESVAPAESYNDVNYELLSEVYRDYSSIVTSLYKKEPNVFGNFRNYSVPEIKNHKRSIDKIGALEIKEENFRLFKESLDQSIESTIEYIVDYTQP
jgi:predicted choloylglycine hydrolase